LAPKGKPGESLSPPPTQYMPPTGILAENFFIPDLRWDPLLTLHTLSGLTKTERGTQGEWGTTSLPTPDLGLLLIFEFGPKAHTCKKAEKAIGLIPDHVEIALLRASQRVFF
jgi:hypothetical protein